MSITDQISEGVHVLDFYSDDCMPCKMLHNVLKEVEKDFQGKAKIHKIKVTDNPEIANKFGIMSLPALLFFKDGDMKHSSFGLIGVDKIRAQISELL